MTILTAEVMLPLLGSNGWMDSMVYRKPTSEEGQLDEESIAHVTHVDEVKCVEQCKKIASIQNAIL